MTPRASGTHEGNWLALSAALPVRVEDHRGRIQVYLYAQICAIRNWLCYT